MRRRNLALIPVPPSVDISLRRMIDIHTHILPGFDDGAAA